MQTVEFPQKSDFQQASAVFGEVLGVYINDDVIDDGMIDITKMRTIARCGYQDYTSVDTIFSMARPQT